MKKYNILIPLICITIICLILRIFKTYPYNSSIMASTISTEDQLSLLQYQTKNLSLQLKSISDSINTYGKSINALEKRLSDLETENQTLQNLLVSYYIEKLPDTTYVSLYNIEYTYYTAAENLGQIGKPAIPSLIERLSTDDDYERALVLYALLLASQADNVKAFCGDDYIATSLDFDARNHPAQVKTALDWWEKYKSNFDY